MEPETYRKTRLALGLTQKQLASALGVRNETICRRERGHLPITLEMELALKAIEEGWRAN